MLPLLLLQLLYKSIWLIAVYLPLRSAGQSTDLIKAMGIGVVVDLIVIPWPYVLATYVKQRGIDGDEMVGKIAYDSHGYSL
jgi:hypothetical protein